jgi:hypothetical protein
VLTLDDTLLLGLWLAYGAAGALVLTHGGAQTRRHARGPDGGGRPQAVLLLAVLTTGGLFTLAVAAVFQAAARSTRPRR